MDEMNEYGIHFMMERGIEMDSIFHRRSIRRFEDRPVEKEKIEQILKAGMNAPTATDDREWYFWVVQDPAVRQQLSTVTPYAGPAARAPLDLVIGYREDAGNAPEYAQINMAIASENIMLEADSLNLGSVMLGIAPHEDRMKKVEDILQMPDGIRAFAVIPIGYPVSEPASRDKSNMDRVTWI